jgi:hypothetical protein
MSTFSIRTYTLVRSEDQSILYSPALPRVGVPYDDFQQPDADLDRLIVVAYKRDDTPPGGSIFERELQLSTNAEAFDKFATRLLRGRKVSFGRRFPYGQLEQPVTIEFQADNDRVVDFRLPD